MATAPSPNDLTRQQLDELDALLQRMLALPLDQPAGSPTVPPPEMAAPNWRVDQPAPVPVPAPRLFTPPLPAEPPRPRPPEPEPAPALILRAPAAPEDAPARPTRVTPELPPAVVSPLPLPEAAVPVAANVLPFPQSPTRTPSPSTPVTPPAPVGLPAPIPADAPVPVVLLPLVAFNWTVDTILGAFGPPGRLVRSGIVKNLLGVVGVGLLVYTAAHVGSLKGWVTLPVPLPWPQ